MNTEITTLNPPVPSGLTKNILSKYGFSCSLIILNGDDETVRADSANMAEHIVFVVEGEATIRFGDVNTIVNRDEALLIPKGKEYTVVASQGWAKVLRIEVPPREIISPQIITFA